MELCCTSKRCKKKNRSSPAIIGPVRPLTIECARNFVCLKLNKGPKREQFIHQKKKKNFYTIVENIHNPHATLYVCGDSKVLLPQITETVIDILAEAPEAEDRDAIKTLIGRLKKEGKYREDVWL